MTKVPNRLPPDQLTQLAETPILLEPGGSSWGITHGSVHIFAFQTDKTGVQTSARRYLFTITALGMLFPIPEAHPRMKFIAVPMPGTRWMQCPDQFLWNTDSRFVEAVEQWVSGWMIGCVRYLQNRPPRERAVSLGQPIVLEPNLMADGGTDVVWCRVESGEGVLFDTEPVSGIFPLAAGGWAGID